MTKEIAQLQAVVDDLLKHRGPVRVLEAGCGSASYIRMPERSTIVGVDVQEEQLRRNQFIDEAILGDLETYELPTAAFDVIICWDVLEHLARPRRALQNFFNALRPGGVIILAFPYVYSLKGLVTKFTPHLLHLLFYRHLLGQKSAGLNGAGPFPTFMRTSISPSRVARMAAEHGLSAALCGSTRAAPRSIFVQPILG